MRIQLSNYVKNLVDSLDFSKANADDIVAFESALAKLQDRMQTALDKSDSNAFNNAQEDLNSLLKTYESSDEKIDVFSMSYDDPLVEAWMQHNHFVWSRSTLQ